VASRKKSRKTRESRPEDRAARGRFAPGNQIARGHVGANSYSRRFITQALISELMEVDPKTGLTNYQLLIRKLLELALKKGDMDAIKFAIERVEGKMPTVALLIDPEGADGDAPIPVTLQISRQNPFTGETDPAPDAGPPEGEQVH
jgi:hypothetical protein